MICNLEQLQIALDNADERGTSMVSSGIVMEMIWFMETEIKVRRYQSSCLAGD